ncbi:MAG TPA: glucokinase [Alphaproteobacteria bacterium]|jgi:glucokinase
MQDDAHRLLGDFGGTTVRLALQRTGHPPHQIRLYEAADFSGADAALRRYLRELRLKAADVPRAAAFAVAGPIIGERIRMTNLPWAISLPALRREFGFETLLAVNDFAAVAESIPYLRAKERRKIGSGQPVARMPVVAFGPGTGLGVSALVPILTPRGGPQRWQAVATEGGHVTLPATTEEDSAIVAELQKRFGHVSAERALSGPGLANLHAALVALNGPSRRKPLTPEAVTRAAQRGDKLACDAVGTFCAMLGTVAGNLALTYGAQGGVYIAGGIVPKLGPLFNARSFRARFAAKGRYRKYLEAIPTYVITHKLPALLGLAAALDRDAAGL